MDESLDTGTPSPISDGGKLGWGQAFVAPTPTLPHDCVPGEGMYTLGTP